MTTVDYSVLDNLEGSTRSFYPQRHWTDAPEAAVDYGITVDDGVVLSSRFYAVGRENATVLFFYGNGETAAGYDVIAPFYNQIGANFFVADYRGYGASGGSPAFTTMLSDARQVLDWLRSTMEELRFTGPVYVMGPVHGPPCCRRIGRCGIGSDQRRHHRERTAQPGPVHRGTGR